MTHPIDPHDPHVHTSARRRLIRGALAAPAVMTISTGSAFAAASNARCLMNGTAVEPIAVKTGTDLFLRVRLYAKPSNGKLFVYGADFPGAGGSFLTITQWHEVNGSTGALLGSPLPGKPGGVNLNSTPSKYVLVRFDTSGNIVGVGPKLANNGSAIGTSCWSSFTTPVAKQTTGSTRIFGAP